MINFYQKCDISIKTTLDFNKFDMDIKLPFYFHIKDLGQDFMCESDTQILEEYSSSEFITQQENNEIRKEYEHMLSYVPLNDFTVDFDEEDLEEYRDRVHKCKDGYIFKNHSYLYSFLVHKLKFNEIDFSLIRNLIDTSQLRLKEKYEKMLKKEMDLDNPEEDLSESFMILRCAFELNRPPIFPENIGKCISEMSLREFLAQRIYMARKCKVEKIQYDKMMKNNGKNK